MKKILQSFFASIGYDVFQRDARNHPELCAKRLADREGVGTVLDVGANKGQYAKTLRSWGYQGKIVSFEPLSAAHGLLSQAAAGDPKWTVAPRCAVGADRSLSQINISANSVSSSLLDMLEAHRQAHPASGYISKEEVEIRTLDELANELCGADEKFFLKIDTQGYESAVLEGASQTLNRCAALQLELSLAPMYAGGMLLEEGLAKLQGLGFRPYATFLAFCDRFTGETYQLDVVFVRQ